MIIVITLIVWLITSFAIYSYRKPTNIKWFFASALGFLLGMLFQDSILGIIACTAEKVKHQDYSTWTFG